MMNSNIMNTLQKMMGGNKMGNPLQMLEMLSKMTGKNFDISAINNEMKNFESNIADNMAIGVINKLYDFYPSDKVDELFLENPDRKDKEKILLALTSESLPRFFKELSTTSIDKLYNGITNRRA